jgi:putative DNA primase/helicase
VRLVPWPVVIPAEERDEHLSGRLALEADAVLGWLVAGYRDWRGQGLAEPETVISATAGYKEESDALRRFIDERCLVGAGFTVRSSELFSAWSKWCANEGEESGTNKAFTEALQIRSFTTRRTNVGVMWSGLGLAAEASE